MIDAPTMHAAALDLARRGWRVIPILPGQKRPSIPEWTVQATTDPDLIGQWWAAWPDHGIGIATGRASGIWVLDVDLGPGKNGDDHLADLEHEHGPLPDTVEVITGSGGRHLYFRVPDGVEIATSAGRLGPGLDVRAEGGQVLAPPTLHPSGRRYEWEAEHHPDDVPVADAPAWLIDLVTAPARAVDLPREPRTPYEGPERPGDRFAAETSWAELLQADGAVCLGVRTDRVSGEPYQLWGRPAMPGEQGHEPHISATLGYRGSDVLKVFTPHWCGVTADGEVWSLVEGNTYSKLGYYAARAHGANIGAAVRAIAEHYGMPPPELDDPLAELIAAPTAAELVAGEEEDDDGWPVADFDALLDGDVADVLPSVFVRDDGAAFFYAGMVNGLWGPSGVGKSWMALTAVAQTLQAGHGVLLIDYEDTARTTHNRLRQLGLSAAQMRGRVLHVTPDLSMNPRALAKLKRLIAEHDVQLAIIDSVGESIALEGINPNEDDGVARWNNEIGKALARLGPTVVLIDHVPKDSENTRTSAPIGSQRKKAAINGSAFMVEAVAGQAPARGRTGRLRFVVAKDRHGTWKKDEVAADVVVESDDAGNVRMTLGGPDLLADPGEQVVEALDRRNAELVSRHLEQHGPMSKRAIEASTGISLYHVTQAVKVLVAEGCAPRPGAGRGSVVDLARCFRCDGGDLDAYMPPLYKRTTHLENTRETEMRGNARNEESRDSRIPDPIGKRAKRAGALEGPAIRAFPRQDAAFDEEQFTSPNTETRDRPEPPTYTTVADLFGAITEEH